MLNPKEVALKMAAVAPFFSFSRSCIKYFLGQSCSKPGDLQQLSPDLGYVRFARYLEKWSSRLHRGFGAKGWIGFVVFFGVFMCLLVLFGVF